MASSTSRSTIRTGAFAEEPQLPLSTATPSHSSRSAQTRHPPDRPQGRMPRRHDRSKSLFCGRYVRPRDLASQGQRERELEESCLLEGHSERVAGNFRPKARIAATSPRMRWPGAGTLGQASVPVRRSTKRFSILSWVVGQKALYCERLSGKLFCTECSEWRTLSSVHRIRVF